jgi:hypothetical protein
MPEAASLTVVVHSAATDQLLSCLRSKLLSYNVEVGEPHGDRVRVIDLGSRLDSLRDLLDQRLDQCAERLSVPERRNLLLVEMSSDVGTGGLTEGDRSGLDEPSNTGHRPNSLKRAPHGRPES